MRREVQTYRRSAQADKGIRSHPPVTWVTRDPRPPCRCCDLAGRAPASGFQGRGGGGGAFCGRRAARPPRPEQGSSGSVPTRYVPSLHRALAPAGGSSDWSAARAAGAAAAVGRGGASGRGSGSTAGAGTGAGRTESAGNPTRCGGIGVNTGAVDSGDRRAAARGATDAGGALGGTGGRSAGVESRGGRASGGPAWAPSGAALATITQIITAARRRAGRSLVVIVMAR